MELRHLHGRLPVLFHLLNPGHLKQETHRAGKVPLFILPAPENSAQQKMLQKEPWRTDPRAPESQFKTFADGKQ